MLYFTIEELQYIVKEFNNWHVADGAPEEIRKSVERKLEIDKKKKEEYRKKHNFVI